MTSRRRPDGAVEVAAIARRRSAKIIGEMDRESINVFAELLFRDAAHAATPDQVGSAQTGLANAARLLTKKVGRVRRTFRSPTAAGFRYSIA